MVIDQNAVRREIEKAVHAPGAQTADIVDRLHQLVFRLADRDPSLMTKDRSDVD